MYNGHMLHPTDLESMELLDVMSASKYLRLQPK